MTLEQTLKNAAYKVWNELEPIPISNQYKIFEVREEALTTMAIKEIYRSTCPLIDRVEMIPGSEESLKGYDFELAIGSKKKGKYIRLFIQAKRLFGKKCNSSFDSMDFKQTDQLLTYARSESSLAIYAFYSHLVENDLILQNHYNSATSYDRRSLGITIASAYSVKRLNSKKFSDYHFNDGLTIPPTLYTLRHFPHLFYFHKESRKHLAVPFHELSYLTIDLAEAINRLFRRIKKAGKTNLLLLLSGFDYFFPGEDLIPILKTSPNELIDDFKRRNHKEFSGDSNYKPEVLIILETGEEEKEEPQ